MTNNKCFLCRADRIEDLCSSSDYRKNQTRYRCTRCGTVLVHDTLWSENGLDTSFRPHLISGYTRELTEKNRDPVLLTAESIYTVLGDASIPRTPSQKLDKLIKHFGAVSDEFGYPHQVDAMFDYSLGYAVGPSEFVELLRCLEEQGYVKMLAAPFRFSLSLLGVEKVEELRHAGPDSRKVFVAMWFDNSMDSVYDKGIALGIDDAGYEPFIIKKTELITKIDDAIIAGIKESRFMVADFTKHRPNVYYEAGLADGLGIPVVRMCEVGQVKKLHFDTRQFSHIVWKDPEDLRQRLYNRIKALSL